MEMAFSADLTFRKPDGDTDFCCLQFISIHDIYPVSQPRADVVWYFPRILCCHSLVRGLRRWCWNRNRLRRMSVGCENYDRPPRPLMREMGVAVGKSKTFSFLVIILFFSHLSWSCIHSDKGHAKPQPYIYNDIHIYTPLSFYSLMSFSPRFE